MVIAQVVELALFVKMDGEAILQDKGRVAIMVVSLPGYINNNE